MFNIKWHIIYYLCVRARACKRVSVQPVAVSRILVSTAFYPNMFLCLTPFYPLPLSSLFPKCVWFSLLSSVRYCPIGFLLWQYIFTNCLTCPNHFNPFTSTVSIISMPMPISSRMCAFRTLPVLMFPHHRLQESISSALIRDLFLWLISHGSTT